jgi:hypothetical protein
VLGLGDDDGSWVHLPFKVAFFSGPGEQNTSLYSWVWICSNGFICFDEKSNSSNPDLAQGSSKPNTFMAPYWSDLKPSSGIISYYVDYVFGRFAVSWYNVLDKKNGKRQTFE